jgi:predicted nucleic acid-binding protein
VIAFDTNVLIYSVDPRDADRKDTAFRLVAMTLRRGDTLLPLRVLAEFLHVGVRKLRLAYADLSALIDEWRAAATVAPCLPEDLDAALDAHARHGLAIFDALIWAVCERAGASILVTEDLQDGQKLGRVTFLDPFNPANARRLGLA